MSLTLLTNEALRAAIRNNLVSFPAQVPAFAKGDPLQVPIVTLYFIRGWRVAPICSRYGLVKSTVRKMITEWSARAVSAGYIQEIYPGAVIPRERETADPEAGLARRETWAPAA
jgi:hypothetical protein